MKRLACVCGVLCGLVGLGASAADYSGLRPGEIEALRQIEQREARDRDVKRDAYQRWEQQRAEEKRLEAASRNGRVVAGMSADQARRVMGGRPDTINRADYGRGEREQWVYDDADGATYIYVEAGRVTGVSHYPKSGRR